MDLASCTLCELPCVRHNLRTASVASASALTRCSTRPKAAARLQHCRVFMASVRRTCDPTPVRPLWPRSYAHCHFYDLWAGKRLRAVQTKGSGNGALSASEEALLSGDEIAISGVALEPNGFGAVFATAAAASSASPLPLGRLLAQMAALSSRGPLASFDNSWRALPQRRVRAAAAAQHATPPTGALLIPGGGFFFRVEGAEIEGDDAHGVDVQFEWEETPHKEHQRNVSNPLPQR